MNPDADPSTEKSTVRLAPPKPIKARGPSGARLAVGSFSVVYGIFLMTALQNLAFASIPFLGYLPGKMWISAMEWPEGVLMVANALYVTLGLLAWHFRSKVMATYFILLPLLGTLIFVMRFAAGMGSFR